MWTCSERRRWYTYLTKYIFLIQLFTPKLVVELPLVVGGEKQRILRFSLSHPKADS